MLTFKQFHHSTELTDLEIYNLAKMIYLTDKYIYPSIFRTETDAVTVLSDLLENSTDSMFNCQNIYVALEENNIVGCILWHDGPLKWNSESLLQAANANNIKLADTFNKVETEYFAHYTSPNLKNILSLINVYVIPSKRNQGIGTLLLHNFIHCFKNRTYQLYCLCDNIPAMKLYQTCGFKLKEIENAFTPDDNTNIKSALLEL